MYQPFLYFILAGGKSKTRSLRERRILGLLGRSIQHRTIFETYRNPPGIDAINTCMLKRTWYCLELRRRAKRANRPFKSSDEPKLWIVTPTGVRSKVVADVAVTPVLGKPTP